MAKDSLRFLGLEGHPVDCTCDILDKYTSTFNYIQYMFDRTNRMFKYQNLPDTIPEPIFEYMLQVYGSVAIIEDHGNLYAMRASFGGPPDPYYRSTQAVIANPALGIEHMYRIDNHLPPFDRRMWDSLEPCVRFLNDSQIMGLLPLFSRYAVQMTENDISIRSAQINSRQQTIIAADSGPDIESANQYIKQVEAGVLSTIQKRSLTEGIQVFNGSTGQSNTIMQLIELQQYLKASWYNEIGLNSNFNMKRQYVSSEEINSTADIMLPLIDNMYNARVMHCEAVNKLFGTNISVEKDSAWAKKQMQSDMSVMGEDDESLSPQSGDDSLVVQSTERDSATTAQSNSQDAPSVESINESEQINEVQTDDSTTVIVETSDAVVTVQSTGLEQGDEEEGEREDVEEVVNDDRRE